MIAYKIVKKAKDKYYSYIIIGKEQIEYKIGEKVRVNDACCFETLEQAENFGYNPGVSTHIFKCEIKKGSKIKVKCCFDDYVYGKICNFVSEDKWPEGTIFASEVTLLEEV